MKLFQKKADGSQDGLAINRISKKANAVLNTVFLLWALACVLPLCGLTLVTKEKVARKDKKAQAGA